MEENIIQHSTGTIIMNGGNGLADCPKDWDEASAVLQKLNQGIEDGPRWSFDCGFKLDFDADLISVSSRFYPPKTHNGPGWNGTCDILIMGVEGIEKKFQCDTLDDLKKEVTEYIDSFVEKLKVFSETIK